MIKFDYTPTFVKNARKLKKRYGSFKDDLDKMLSSLAENPEQGVALGDGFRKIRMSIKSKVKGKSGGARLITINCMVSEADGIVTLVTIYDKSDIENITLNAIKKAYSGK